MAKAYEGDWAEADRLSDKYENSGNFRNLKDHDDFVIGALIGSPLGRELHWDQAKNGYRECTLKDDCKDCKDGLNLSVRYWMCMFTAKVGTGQKVTEEPLEVEVLELSRPCYKAIVAVKVKYGGLEKSLFEIRRNGAKGDTNTTYMVLQDERINELEDDLQQAIQEADPIDLKALRDRMRDGGGDDDDSLNGGSGRSSAKGREKPKEKRKERAQVVDPDVMGELAADLRELPKARVADIKRELGIKKLRELRPNQVERLQELIDADPDDDSDKDPFDDI